jgi:hypothetical protein
MDLITKREREWLKRIRSNLYKAKKTDIIKINYLVFKAWIGLKIQELTLFYKQKRIYYLEWKLRKEKRELEKIVIKRILLDRKQ